MEGSRADLPLSPSQHPTHSLRPHAVMRGSLLSAPFLSFLLLIRALTNTLVSGYQHHHPPSIPLHLTPRLEDLRNHSGLNQVTPLSFRCLPSPVKVPPLSSPTDGVCEECTLDLILTRCGMVLRMAGEQWGHCLKGSSPFQVKLALPSPPVCRRPLRCHSVKLACESHAVPGCR